MFSSAVLGGGFTSVAVLRALLDTSDDPHCCDVDGNARSAGGLAALQLALISGGSAGGESFLVLWLIRNRADASADDDNGNTSVSLAEEPQDPFSAVADLMRSARGRSSLGGRSASTSVAGTTAPPASARGGSS